jgi:hypothetical protein
VTDAGKERLEVKSPITGAAGGRLARELQEIQAAAFRPRDKQGQGRITPATTWPPQGNHARRGIVQFGGYWCRAWASILSANIVGCYNVFEAKTA